MASKDAAASESRVHAASGLQTDPPLRNPLAISERGPQHDHRGPSRTDPSIPPTPAAGSSSTSRLLSLGTPRSRRPQVTRGPPPAAAGAAAGATPAAADAPQAQASGILAPPSTGSPHADAAVRATDSDALVSRLSALEAGYMLEHDPYAALFLSSAPTAAPPRAGPSDAAPGRLAQGVQAAHAAPPSASASISEAPIPLLAGRSVPGRAYSPPPFASPFAPRSARFPPGSSSHDAPAGSSSGSSSSSSGQARRPPVLNIGTYLRCTALDRVITSFLQQNGDGDGDGAHIISVGAGSDSRYWRIQADAGLASTLAHYTELDFREITRAKVHSVNRSPVLSAALQPLASQPVPDAAVVQAQAGVQLDAEQGIIASNKYSLFPCDLRTLAQDSASAQEPNASVLDERIRAHIRKHSRPEAGAQEGPKRKRRRTLVLAECVLAYLEPRDADALLLWFASLARPSASTNNGAGADPESEVMILSFDMCVEGGGADRTDRSDGLGAGELGRFGRMMLQNIESRGLPLHGARAYSTPSAYTRRYERILGAANAPPQVGLGSVPRSALRVRTGAKTLTQLWRELDSQEKQRISRLERLDEVEELEMLMDHYCICWGLLERDPTHVPL